MQIRSSKVMLAPQHDFQRICVCRGQAKGTRGGCLHGGEEEVRNKEVKSLIFLLTGDTMQPSVTVSKNLVAVVRLW